MSFCSSLIGNTTTMIGSAGGHIAAGAAKLSISAINHITANLSSNHTADFQADTDSSGSWFNTGMLVTAFCLTALGVGAYQYKQNQKAQAKAAQIQAEEARIQEIDTHLKGFSTGYFVMRKASLNDQAKTPIKVSQTPVRILSNPQAPNGNAAAAIQLILNTRFLAAQLPNIIDAKLSEGALFGAGGVAGFYERNRRIFIKPDSANARTALAQAGKILQQNRKVSGFDLTNLLDSLIVLQNSVTTTRELNELVTLLEMRKVFLLQQAERPIPKELTSALYQSLRRLEEDTFPETIATCDPAQISIKLAELIGQKKVFSRFIPREIQTIDQVGTDVQLLMFTPPKKNHVYDKVELKDSSFSVNLVNGETAKFRLSGVIYYDANGVPANQETAVAAVMRERRILNPDDWYLCHPKANDSVVYSNVKEQIFPYALFAERVTGLF